MAYGYIYKTTNLTNNKLYIGQHKKTIWDNNYKGSGTLFSQALKKYGWENFHCELIEWHHTLEDLNEREIFWIEYYQSRNKNVGYNLARGGEQVVVGCTVLEQEQISLILTTLPEKISNDLIQQLKELGLRIYEKGEGWQPTIKRSTEIKMTASENSIAIKFYTKNQMAVAKGYSNKYQLPVYNYNVLAPINLLPDIMTDIKHDIEHHIVIPETFRGPSIGTSGIFVETSRGSGASLYFK